MSDNFEDCKAEQRRKKRLRQEFKSFWLFPFPKIQGAVNFESFEDFVIRMTNREGR